MEILDNKFTFDQEKYWKKISLGIKTWWLFYLVFLIKSTMIDSWGYIDAGIDKLEISISKVIFFAFFPFLGITLIVWKTKPLKFKEFILLIIFSGTLMFVGIIAYFRLKYLRSQNNIVRPSNQAILFSLVNSIFTVIIIFIFILKKRLKP